MSSSRFVVLESGQTRVTIAPRYGGRIVQIEFFDGNAWHPLLLSPDDPQQMEDEPLLWGSFVMAPWPGRMTGARFGWRGDEYRVPATFGRHAIHGMGVRAPWNVASVDAKSCRLELDRVEGWPFAARITQEITVLAHGVSQRVTIGALDSAMFPAGMGWHPWFRRHVRAGGDVRLRVESSEMYETDEDLIPTGRLAAVTGEFDLRDSPTLGERRLDACYRHLRGAIELRWGNLRLEMASSPNVGHGVAYTPEHAVCVEPQTCAPDAFNLAHGGITGTGVAVVGPGQPLVADTTWRWRLDPAITGAESPDRPRKADT